MSRLLYLLSIVVVLGSQAGLCSQDKVPAPPPVPDGVYAVWRDSEREKDVLPLKNGETLVVNRYRYLKPNEHEPPRYVVVHAVPEVALDLAEKPKADKEGDEVVRILLTLEPKQAKALERLTREHRGRQIAIVLNGEVVTMHKIREVIKDGKAQITSCAAGAAGYLLEQLQAHHKK
jgi:preprotein translocase subunit SecD